MTKSFKLSSYIKEESKSISISVPISQYTTLEKLAEITHRPIPEISSEIFVDHTLPKIKNLLQAEVVATKSKATLGETPTPKASADLPPAVESTIPSQPKQVAPTPSMPMPSTPTPPPLPRPNPILPVQATIPPNLSRTPPQLIPPTQKPPAQPLTKPSGNDSSR